MKTDLLNPQNSAIIFIDHQPQMTFGVANNDPLHQHIHNACGADGR